MSCVLATTPVGGAYVPGVRNTSYDVGLHLTIARTGLHDGGAGKVADAPGEPEVGEHLPKESP